MNWQKQNCDGIIAEYAETEKSPVIKPVRYILGDKGFFQSLKHTCTYVHSESVFPWEGGGVNCAHMYALILWSA